MDILTTCHMNRCNLWVNSDWSAREACFAHPLRGWVRGSLGRLRPDVFSRTTNQFLVFTIHLLETQSSMASYISPSLLLTNNQIRPSRRPQLSTNRRRSLCSSTCNSRPKRKRSPRRCKLLHRQRRRYILLDLCTRRRPRHPPLRTCRPQHDRGTSHSRTRSEYNH